MNICAKFGAFIIKCTIGQLSSTTTTNEMNTKISLNGEVLEEVESFVYLGSIFTRDGSCTNDIRKRLAMGTVINMEKQGHFYNHKNQTPEGIGLVSSNIRV